MTTTDIKTVTANHLGEYGLFSTHTIARIANFAKKQATYKTYQDFFKAVGMPRPKLHSDARGRGVTYVDIPAQKLEKGVIVYHLPMANPLDENQLYQIATIAGVLPEYRIIAFGNPSGAPYAFKEQNLTLFQRLKIAFGHNYHDLVAAELDYLDTQRITKAYQVGYSFGAMKALVESLYAPEGLVRGIVAIEPVAHPRYKLQLLGDFERTLQPLGEYVNRTGLNTYFAARKAAEIVDYQKGLRRQINIAIGLMLSRIDFITVLKQVLQRQPQASASVAWATKSELGNDAHLSTVLTAMQKNGAPIKTFRLKDDTHAALNDIHLLAAIMYQSLHA